MAAYHNYQLSREDEAAAGADGNDVRREDQDKINKFSRLHQRESVLVEDLKTKQVGQPAYNIKACHNQSLTTACGSNATTVELIFVALDGTERQRRP